MKKNKIRLYRFFNLQIGQYGKYFAICGEHKARYKVPDNCILEEVAKNPVKHYCQLCEKEIRELIRG